MSRPDFETRVVYLGNGTEVEFTFDFKIVDKEHLKAILIDETGVEVWTVRGTDTTYFSTTTDAKGYSGKCTFVDPPPDDYKLILLLADDEPKQTANFTGDPRFTNAKLEAAFDMQSGQIQRLKYQINRTVLMPENYVAAFDPTLPTPVGSGVLIVNAENTAFEFVPLATIREILERLDNAEDAIEDLQIRMADVEAKNIEQDLRLDQAETAADVLEQRVETAEGEIDVLQTEVDQLQIAIGSVQSAADSAAAAAASAASASGSATAAAGSALAAAASAGNVQDIYADLAAILAALPPGAITTILGGGGGTTGVMRQDYVDKTNIHPTPMLAIEYDGLKEYSETGVILPFISGLLFGNVDGLAAMTITRKNFTKQNLIINVDHQPEAIQEMLVAYCYSTCGFRFVIDFFGYGNGVTNNFTLSAVPKNTAMVKGYRNGVKALQGNVTAAMGDLTFLDGPPTDDQLVFAVYQVDEVSMFDNRVEFLNGVRDGNNRIFGPVLFRPADKLSAILTYNGIAWTPGSFKIVDRMIIVQEGFEPEDTQIPELDYCYAL